MEYIARLHACALAHELFSVNGMYYCDPVITLHDGLVATRENVHLSRRKGSKSMLSSATECAPCDGRRTERHFSPQCSPMGPSIPNATPLNHQNVANMRNATVLKMIHFVFSESLRDVNTK